MTEKRQDGRLPGAEAPSATDACPNCGQKLSPWQQVLLSVDRALVCKNCRYRILLDIPGEGSAPPAPDKG